MGDCPYLVHPHEQEYGRSPENGTVHTRANFHVDTDPSPIPIAVFAYPRFLFEIWSGRLAGGEPYIRHRVINPKAADRTIQGVMCSNSER